MERFNNKAAMIKALAERHMTVDGNSIYGTAPIEYAGEWWYNRDVPKEKRDVEPVTADLIRKYQKTD